MIAIVKSNMNRFPIDKNPGVCHRIMTFYSVQLIQ